MIWYYSIRDRLHEIAAFTNYFFNIVLITFLILNIKSHEKKNKKSWDNGAACNLFVLYPYNL
jgi:lipopolysaccharide biosynthesis protein